MALPETGPISMLDVLEELKIKREPFILYKGQIISSEVIQGDSNKEIFAGAKLKNTPIINTFTQCSVNIDITFGVFNGKLPMYGDNNSPLNNPPKVHNIVIYIYDNFYNKYKSTFDYFIYGETLTIQCLDDKENVICERTTWTNDSNAIIEAFTKCCTNLKMSKITSSFANNPYDMNSILSYDDFIKRVKYIQLVKK